MKNKNEEDSTVLRLKQSGRLIAMFLACTMLFTAFAAAAAPGKSAGAAYEAVQLTAAPTKVMEYLATQSPAGVTWIENADALDFLPAAAIGDVTCAVKDGDITWIGTENGAMRVDFAAADARDIVQYFSGTRYLYGGDDHVTGIALDGAGGVWLRNAQGSVHIAMVPLTMQERGYFYEKTTADVNDRNGMVSENTSYTYDPATDEYYGTNHTDDNDGLWTAMYALGEIFRYQTLKADGAAEAEIAAAKAAATRATKAVLLLDYVSGRGNGFPCRSYMMTSEPAAALSGAFGNFQNQNGFWFEMRMLDEGEAYPEPIIPEMRRERMDPIGIATVRFTKDAMEKRGSRLFANDDVTDGMTWNGLSLSQSSIDAFNEARPEGQKLGTDIYSENNQVYPVMIDGVNTGGKRASTTSVDPDKVVFRLTVPVYEQVPQLFNDLFPDEMIKNDYVDMEKIVYKADTSSDEVVGHYALFLNAYRYLCDEAEDAELKSLIAETALRMTDLIMCDEHYYILDATGKSTQWSRWFSKYFNDGIGQMEQDVLWAKQIGVINGEDALSYGFEDASLNALEVMAALKIASHIAEAEGNAAAQAKYDAAYTQCFDASYSKGAPYVNGKGYINMALEHVKRRLIRQATDAYGELGVPLETVEQAQEALAAADPGDRDDLARLFNAVLHNDWTQYVNYSDEELCWFPAYSLLTLEEDAVRREKIVAAYDQWYVDQEEREDNPFYTYLYQIAHPEKTDIDLESCARYFYRSPLVRNESDYVRGDRQDTFYIEPGVRDKGKSQWNYALPLDETKAAKNNGNPFTRYDAMGAGGAAWMHTSGDMGGAAVFTLPYWMGRFYGMLEETTGTAYELKAPAVILAANDANAYLLTATVKDGETGLKRVIVDFFAGEEHAYIGRGRTDENGAVSISVPRAHAGQEVIAQANERLIGDVVYTLAISNAVMTPPLTDAVYTYEQVLADGFDDTEAKATIKQFVSFLTDPTYAPSNNLTGIDLPNAASFVNKDFDLAPSLFPSLRSVAASALSADRSTLWIGYADGGVDCIDPESGDALIDTIASAAVRFILADGSGAWIVTTENVIYTTR